MIRSAQNRPRPLRARARGFTLAELLAVMGIIAVLAAVATPGFAEMIRERRTQRETAMFSETFRSARAKALGRGAAVMVEVGINPPSMATYEKIDVTGMPVASCNAAGPVDDPHTWRFVENVQGRPGATDIHIFIPNAVAESAELRVCYSPRGRTYFNTDGGDGFPNQLNGVIDIRTNRVGDNAGQKRSIMVLPNGQTRVSL